MKGLFVVFHGFSAHSGISKKIFSQCDALRRNGADVELCHLEIAADGTQRRMVGGRAIRTFGQGLRAKVAKRVSLGDITRHIRDEGVEFLYIRHDHNASPVLIHWLRKVKKLGVRIALEIPTYPYDAEFAQSPFVRRLKLRIDRTFRRRMARWVDRIVTFSDANTMLNPEAVTEIVRCFEDPQVGCVAGEKRVADAGGAGAAATEGVYWKYESKLKELDYRLYSAVGAAGELFAVRRGLWQTLPEDTLLDDFVCSMLIAAQGYKIAYCKEAYALETPSADMGEEGKRKKRIAAGGLQSVWRLRKLLNPFRYGVLWFQYVSHRVLRWTLTPVVLVALLPLNVALLWSGHPTLYAVTLGLQCAFYLAALAGRTLERSGRRSRLLFIPYYFLFMNLNVFRGTAYLATHRGRGAWEKAKRA